MRRMWYLLVGLVAWGPAFLLGGCALPGDAAGGGAATRPELIIFAAASLTDAFTQLGDQFEAAQPGVTVLFNFAGSQQLAQQIGQGAPADVFAAANLQQMESAVAEGRVRRDDIQDFAHNGLVVVYPSENPAGLASLHDLARPGLKLVLAAPAVPAGSYALDFLAKASATVDYGATYSPTVLANVVSYEANVRGVLSKVRLGEADAGIVYASDTAGSGADQLGQIEIPPELNSIATYPIAPLVDARHPDLAQAFVDLVLSAEGQAVLAAHGFVPVAEP